jgi:anaerobic selenocysteine-containing dehydrogenase
LSSLIEDYTPESIATHTGISAEDVRALAKDFATAPRAVVYGRMGVSVQTFGGVCHWLINIINLLTGNFDREGGAMFPSPAFDLLSRARRGYNCFNRWQSGVRSLPEFEGEFPVAAMAEEIEVGNIKAIFTIGGNPVLSTPNGTALDKAFASLNFMVSFDIYINETTRHANIILPPTTGLEAAHYDVIFHHLAVRNTAKFSEPLFEKEETQRHDWEILEELRYRLIGEESTPQNPEIKLALGLQYGRYGATGLTLEKLKAEPHGIDLGTLQPVMPERLLTENGRINLLPDLLVKDLKRVKNNLSQSQNNGYDLLLIGRRHLRSNNSWMHNTERLMKGRERCTLLIHPVTAECLGIQNKETVRVESRVGSISAPIEITEDIMPDVVSLPHGFGHGREGVQLDIATQYAGASINDLTDHLRIDELTGNAAFSGVPVRIEKTT